jgi:2-haloacid dehalogenase
MAKAAGLPWDMIFGADLHAARKLGLRTCFFARSSEYGPHQDKDFSAESDWDIVAADIEDLA